MTKVCFLSHRNFTNFPRAQKQLESLARQEGIDVVAIGTQMFNDRSKTYRQGDATIRHVRLPVRAPMVGPLKVLNTLIATVTLLAVARREQADVYHCFNVYALIAGSILGRVQSCQTTYDASEPNGLQVRIEFPGRVGNLMERLVTAVEGRLAARAVAIFTVNSSRGVPYERLARRNPNTVILENVPALSEFEVEEAEGSPFDEYEDREVLLYVGGVSERKGGDMMVEAMDHVVEEHPEAHLLLIGGGSDEYLAHLRRRIDELELTDNVSLLGPVDYDRVPAYLADATLGFQLYQPDPWTSQSKASSTVFRFMGAGLPLVVTDLEGIGSIVESLECGVTAPVDDPVGIAVAISRLLSDESRADELASNGRRQVRTRYNWGVEEAKFLEKMPVSTSSHRDGESEWHT